MIDLSANWDDIDAEFDWIRAMRDCPQDPEFHAEGDVWVHTRAVCEALASDERFRWLGDEEREVLFAAALMHDISKPECTRREGGRIRSPGHSAKGAIRARRILWELNWPLAKREAVAALVRHHMTPYHLLEAGKPQRRLFFASQTARCDWSAILSTADVRGRICRDQQRLLDNIALFEEMARDEGCLSEPKMFASDHSRFLYFRKEDRDPNYAAYDDTRCEVVILSGLPASGKDTWIERHGEGKPVVSLDALREQLHISPGQEQGTVIAAAKQLARKYLRESASFIWNGTNLSREIRAQIIDLATAYNARIRIVYVEASHADMKERNAQRAKPVPPAAIERMLSRWEMPDPTEAHEVDVAVTSCGE
jgi:predicted kinase